MYPVDCYFGVYCRSFKPVGGLVGNERLDGGGLEKQKNQSQQQDYCQKYVSGYFQKSSYKAQAL